MSVNRFANTFINHLVDDPELVNTGNMDASMFMLKRSLTRLDEFSSSLVVNLLTEDDLLTALEAIPTPSLDIASNVNYLVVVRRYLIRARELDMPYPKDQIIDLIHSKISVPTAPSSLIADYCTNLYWDVNANQASMVMGGLTGGLTGSIIGFPIGFFVGCVFLLTRPYVAKVMGILLLCKTLHMMCQRYL